MATLITKLTTELEKYPSFNDFLMFQPGMIAINQLLKGVTELSKFSHHASVIGDYSANGFIRKLEYTNNDHTLDVVLKSNRTKDGDNLYYEYLAGQCINEFSKYYPFFSRTYGLGIYLTYADWNVFNKMEKMKKFPHPMDEYIEFLNPVEFVKNVETSCIDSLKINIMTQFIPIKSSLFHYIMQFTSSDDTFDPKYTGQLTFIILILYLVYGCLSKLANYFTHYDLHMDNITLYKIPDTKYVDVIVKTDNGELHFKTIYLPIIIDYGRSYFDCHAVSVYMLNSPTLMKSVCSYDSNSPYDKCPDYCGDEVGYSFMGSINSDGSINPTSSEDFYINRGRRNISHDLRGLSDLSKRIGFHTLYSDIPYCELWQKFLDGLVYSDYDEFGMPEISDSNDDGIINNVFDVVDALETMIRQPEFISDNEFLLKESSNNISYGVLTLDFSNDSMIPFEFIKY